MQRRILSEGPRTIHLSDWSHKEEKTRHVLWCVSYRLLAKGETLRAAKEAVAEKLGISKMAMRRHCSNTIHVINHDHGKSNT